MSVKTDARTKILETIFVMASIGLILTKLVGSIMMKPILIKTNQTQIQINISSNDVKTQVLMVRTQTYGYIDCNPSEMYSIDTYMHTCITMHIVSRKYFLRFSSNSEAFASELLENYGFMKLFSSRLLVQFYKLSTYFQNVQCRPDPASPPEVKLV